MLSETLKRLRDYRGITQAELAQILGITQQAVAKWERNKSEPDSSGLKQLSKYFGVSIDYLLDNEEKKSFFNEDETKLIHNYRNLDGDGRSLLLEFIGLLRLHSKKNKNNSNVVQSNSGGRNFLTVNGNQYIG